MVAVYNRHIDYGGRVQLSVDSAPPLPPSLRLLLSTVYLPATVLWLRARQVATSTRLTAAAGVLHRDDCSCNAVTPGPAGRRAQGPPSDLAGPGYVTEGRPFPRDQGRRA